MPQCEPGEWRIGIMLVIFHTGGQTLQSLLQNPFPAEMRIAEKEWRYMALVAKMVIVYK